MNSDGKLAAAALVMAAANLDGVEALRIAAASRVGAKERDGWLVSHPALADAVAFADTLMLLEKQAAKNLERAMRLQPLGAWVKRTTGVGEKQAARLLAVLGDPYWHPIYDRPRTLGELRAFCGMHVIPSHIRSEPQTKLAGDDEPFRPAQHSGASHRPGGVPESSCIPSQRTNEPQSTPAGDANFCHPAQDVNEPQVMCGGVAPSRRRGHQTNWSSEARSRLWLIAESCIKHRSSPYRAVYDNGRAKYADATHNEPCPRCGPKGKPAPAGSALSAGHQHARAMRLVAKAVLRDLWEEARALHHTDEQRTVA